MNTYTISKIETSLEKDSTLGIISKMVTYKINHDEIKKISMLGSLSHVFPDHVEIKVVNDDTKEHIINSITYTVNQIALKEYTINTCPMCGSQIIHFTNTHVCPNINCLKVDKTSISILCLKLITLFPSVPSYIFSNTLNEFDNMDNLSVLGVIEHIKEKYTKDLTNKEMEFVIKTMKDLRLENIFAASIGNFFLKELTEISKHYDNSLTTMLADVDYVFENLYHLCDERLRIFLVIILRTNKQLLDLVLL